jgi:hypothetical protein
MATDKDKDPTDAQIAAFLARRTSAADKEARERVDKARADQEAIDKAVSDAIWDKTHDKDGNPIPLVGN